MASDATECPLAVRSRPLIKAQSGPICDRTGSRDVLRGGPFCGHSLGPWVLVALWKMELLERARDSWANAFPTSGQLWGNLVHETARAGLV